MKMFVSSIALLLSACSFPLLSSAKDKTVADIAIENEQQCFCRTLFSGGICEYEEEFRSGSYKPLDFVKRACDERAIKIVKVIYIRNLHNTPSAVFIYAKE